MAQLARWNPRVADQLFIQLMQLDPMRGYSTDGWLWEIPLRGATIEYDSDVSVGDRVRIEYRGITNARRAFKIVHTGEVNP